MYRAFSLHEQDCEIRGWLPNTQLDAQYAFVLLYSIRANDDWMNMTPLLTAPADSPPLRCPP